AGKQPNARNLYDMLGNVWEWTADWYWSALSGGADPAGPADGRNKVLRGGSWWGRPSDARASARAYYHKLFRFSGYGCRCALD
ncbi:MAG: SUMF1/EgtB/PvdO family nonheme iron enzyme, partial [Acidobacteria bacterium]|nr:SUMF1/EgtB/PvdO family nonheme iron enzyme [Acidobacteriota bacterium]